MWKISAYKSKAGPPLEKRDEEKRVTGVGE